MTGTLLRIEWINLKRDRIALLIVFILPIVFFSIFAAIFASMGSGGGDGDESQQISTIVIDEDQSEISTRLVDALRESDQIEAVTERTLEDGATAPFTRELAIARVQDSDADALIVIPEGFGNTFMQFDQDRAKIEIIYDPTNPFAKAGTEGILQGVVMQSAPDLFMEQGMTFLEEWGGELTDSQREAIELIKPYLRGDKPWSELEDEGTVENESPSDGGADFAGLVPVASQSVRAFTNPEADDPDSMIPYYAAGIGVMFLLFSMVGAAGTLLKEQETGSLERVLTSNISMTRLLASKWMFFGLVGAIQVVMMFAWGELIFGGMDLFALKHFVPFVVMTVFTAGAAAAFGIMLASLVRSRGQLDGMATIIILIMSAVGGSMVPRIFMPDFMKTVGNFTFNGHALDGFLKVFWRSRPDESVVTVLTSILPQLAIIAGMGAAFFLIARLAARRWEVV